MIKYPVQTFADSAELLAKGLAISDLAEVSRALQPLNVSETLEQLERLKTIDRAVAYRTLPKSRAIEVFERLEKDRGERFLIVLAHLENLLGGLQGFVALRVSHLGEDEADGGGGGKTNLV